MFFGCHQLPNKIIDLLSERSAVSDYLYLLKRLDQLSMTLNHRNANDTHELLNTLRDIEVRLMRFEMNTNVQDEFEVEMINHDSARVFRLYGGIEV